VQRAIGRRIYIIAGIIDLIPAPPIVSAEMVIDDGISLFRVRHQLFKQLTLFNFRGVSEIGFHVLLYPINKFLQGEHPIEAIVLT
jgi:hypothetical protein